MPTAKTIQKTRDWQRRSALAAKQRLLDRIQVAPLSKLAQSPIRAFSVTRLKPGKKAKEWNNTRAVLKQRFARAGITSCELRYDGCLQTFGLSFCHSKKRRNITTQAELKETALGCANCHSILELKKEAEMTQIVRSIRESNPV